MTACKQCDFPDHICGCYVQPSKPLTDELLNATKMAIQCSYMDHGRRSVNAQAWDRMIQAIAAHTHAIEAAHGIKGDA